MPGSDERSRHVPIWHGAMYGLCVCTGVLIVLSLGVRPADRWAALALLAALLGWYLVVGRTGLQRHRGVAYLVLAGPLTVVLFAVAPIAALMLFAIYPHIWAMLSMRAAVWATVG